MNRAERFPALTAWERLPEFERNTSTLGDDPHHALWLAAVREKDAENTGRDLPAPPPRLVPPDDISVGHIGTDFGALAAAQAGEAAALTRMDVDTCPRVPWDTLHEVTGHLLPWQWWVVAAMTGQGKSTLLLSLVAHWIAQERPVYMLPLEQSPDVMRLMLAALRRGLDPRRVVAGRWDRLPENARTLVTQDLAWQASAEGATLLHFNPQVNVGAGDLERVMRDAVDFGADVLIIDHLHALDPGTTYSGFRRLCVVLNELPKAARIPVLTTAQMHRGEGDPLAAHRAPRATGIQMGDVVRQFAHIVLGAWRPLSREPSKAEQVRIRTRQIEVREFLEPNCIELAVLKQRVDGDQAGQRVRLRYEHGEIVDPTWEQVHRWSREAQGQTQLHVEDR